LLTLTDDILWDSFRQGNKEALAKLFERHYAQLFRYAHKIYPDREAINDLIQDLFLEIWQQRDPKPVLSIKGYLLQAIRYKLIRLIRSGAETRSMEEQDTPFVMSAEDLRIRQEEDAAWNKQLAEAIQQLSPRQREVVYLRFYLSLSYRDICSILSLDYQIARNHLHQGIKRLRGILEQRSISVPALPSTQAFSQKRIDEENR
jgi:RNA polymerase sigma factor (sigma-70 family)